VEAFVVTVLRPLSTSELLDRTFHLYRNNFLIFLGITAIPQLFILALQLGGAAMLWGRQAIGAGATAVAAGIGSYVAIEVSHAATIMAVSDLNLDRPTSIGSSYSAAKNSLLRVIGITLGVGIASGIGLILLIVPGIYLFLMWSLAIPVTVLEGGGLNASTSRSTVLTKGSRGRIFVIYFLILVLTFIVALVLQFVLLLPLGIMMGVIGMHDPTATIALTQALQAVGGFISTSLVGPLISIALTLIYYDQRVRKEGFDLQLMMSTLEGGGQAATAAPAGATGV
jgi:Membrane domain of glycerophosphoryl diester phosphodiesterase